MPAKPTSPSMPVLAAVALLAAAPVLATLVVPETQAQFYATPIGGDVGGRGDHFQECVGNDHDDDPMTATQGQLCNFNTVSWVLPGSVALTEAGALSDATGVMWPLVYFETTLWLDGETTYGASGQEYVSGFDSTEDQAVGFVTCDEDAPDLLASVPQHCVGLPSWPAVGTDAGDCVVLTNDSNETTGETNDGPDSVAGIPDVTARFHAHDRLGDSFAVSGAMHLVEDLRGAPAATNRWQSDVVALALPAVGADLVLETALDSHSWCGTYHDDGSSGNDVSASLHDRRSVRWDGEVLDVTTYRTVGVGGCGASTVDIVGGPSAHGADYDGATTILLSLDGRRRLVNSSVEAPGSSVLYDYEPDLHLHRWSVATPPGTHEVRFEATTECLPPYYAPLESLSETYTQWSAHQCAASPAAAAPTQLNVGFHTMPALDVGDTYHGADVVHVDATLGFAAVSVPPTAAPIFLEQTDADANLRYCAANQAMTGHLTPNDSFYAQQYGPAHVQAPAAWDTTVGDTDRNVCVVDSGYDAGHADLVGARFVAGPDYIENDLVPNDENGHGTHVAGIAGATLNNAEGIAGISQSGMLIVRALDENRVGSDAGVATAIRWCADNGGDVINLSLGRPGTAADSPALLDAVNYAWNQGSLLVASTGNDNTAVGVPALYDNVVAVGCTDENDVRCGFSNFGPEVDIAAPGNNILSTCTDALPLCDQAPPDGCGVDGITDYTACSGTSMSAPHVSGAAALIWSQHTGLTNDQVRRFLQCTAEDLGAPGLDPLFGRGLLDIDAALDAAASSTCPPPPAPVITGGNAGQTTADIDWTLLNDGGSRLTGFKVYRGACSGCETFRADVGDAARSFHDTGLTASTNYFYQVSAVNEFGGEGPRSNEFLVRTTNPPPPPTPPNGGTMECYPIRGTASTGGVVNTGSSLSGTYTIQARGSYTTGTGANCVFDIIVDPVTSGSYRVIPTSTNSCTAAKGSSCLASTTFNWQRTNTSVCFDAIYHLRVNGSIVANGKFRFCDPPLVDYVPGL